MPVITQGIFADEVVFHVASVIIPLEHVGAPHAGGGRGLVVEHHTHLTPTGGLIHIPIPGETPKKPQLRGLDGKKKKKLKGLWHSLRFHWGKWE